MIGESEHQRPSFHGTRDDIRLEKSVEIRVRVPQGMSCLAIVKSHDIVDRVAALEDATIRRFAQRWSPALTTTSSKREILAMSEYF